MLENDRSPCRLLRTNSQSLHFDIGAFSQSLSDKLYVDGVCNVQNPVEARNHCDWEIVIRVHVCLHVCVVFEILVGKVVCQLAHQLCLHGVVHGVDARYQPTMIELNMIQELK